MKTIFIFFFICNVSAFASTPWLNENSTDLGISEGDIAFKDAPQSNEQIRETDDYQGHGAASEPIRKWENKTVPYNIPSNFDKKQSAIILAAMAEVEDKTCIRFVRRQQQKDYVSFKKHGSICSSIVGREGKGGRQHVNLTDACVERNSVLHELMHVLGFHHEHSRHDRDKHIEIDLNHVRAEHKQRLKFKRKVDPLDLHRPYDYKSITHYPVDAYSIYTNGITTIRSKSPYYKIKADGLSEIDIWKIKNIYNCLNEHPEDTTTNIPNIYTTTVDQQKTTSQQPTIQSTIKQVQSSSSTVMSETSISTTSRMTTTTRPTTTRSTTRSTTTRPISILNKEIIKAVEEGNETTVRTLLNEGADVNARKIGEYRNKTLLHIASEKGRVNVVSLLLDKGANIEAKDKEDFTPLHYAARDGLVNVSSLLLDKRANIEARNTYNSTPLHLAASNSYVNVVSLLLDKGANIEAKDKYNETPLHEAASRGHVNVVSLLLDKGANIQARSTSIYSPLHKAAENGHVNVALLLLDKGANIEARNKHNSTPLHWAASKGYVNVVSLLLNKGANTEARNTYNSTPLHKAAFNGHVDVVSLLLDKGANIEAKDETDWTPLHYAARDGLVNVVSLLLHKGANIEAKTQRYSTPLDVARRENKRAVVEILERKQRELTG